MLGAMIGDVIGSTYEWHPVKQTAFALFPQGSRFTDDSVLTAAVADALLHKTDGASMEAKAYALRYKQYYARYPDAGFGEMFRAWAVDSRLSIRRSYGNSGSAMICPVPYLPFDRILILTAVPAAPFRLLSGRFWNPTIMKARSVWRFPWEATATPWLASPAALPMPITAPFPPRLPPAECCCWTAACGEFCEISPDVSAWFGKLGRTE